MKEIGQKLREAREKKNISLQEIQDITKIRLRYLEAIESGDLEVIPGEVYRKGFICNYANAVGLDGEAILQEYNRLKEKTTETISVPKPSEPQIIPEAPVPVVSETREISERDMETSHHTIKRKIWRPKPVALLLWAGLILTGIVLAWIISQEVMRPVTGPATRESAVKPEVSRKPSLHVSPSPDTVSASPSTTVKQLYPAPITVYAEFTDTVWVQVTSDGRTLFTDNGMTFNRQTPRQLWTAQNEMKIRMGNAGGVKLILNGKDLGMVGEAGMPKTITLNANGIASPAPSITPSPAP